jgi:ryanodine receptor 2
MNMTETGGEEEEEDVEELVSMSESSYYLEHILRFLAICHSLAGFSMLVAYYCLKVPLVIFKREKEIARKLEFDGLWIAEQPGEDDLKSHWDKLVLSTSSFPDSYWDKFVKKKVSSCFNWLFFIFICCKHVLRTFWGKKINFKKIDT